MPPPPPPRIAPAPAQLSSRVLVAWLRWGVPHWSAGSRGGAAGRDALARFGHTRVSHVPLGRSRLRTTTVRAVAGHVGQVPSGEFDMLTPTAGVAPGTSGPGRRPGRSGCHDGALLILARLWC